MGTYDEETGRLEMPAMLRSNHTWMQGHGVYLIGENHPKAGNSLFLTLSYLIPSNQSRIDKIMTMVAQMMV
jgi:hypothetical protein